jgi:hypothetical protein
MSKRGSSRRQAMRLTTGQYYYLISEKGFFGEDIFRIASFMTSFQSRIDIGLASSLPDKSVKKRQCFVLVGRLTCSRF